MRDNKSAYNAAIYDDHIVNVLPYYREYHGQILDLVRSMERVWTMEKGRNAEKRGIDWLDTGCGTGTLAARVLDSRDDVRFTLCDPSPRMLDLAREKLKGRGIHFLSGPSQDLSFSEEFDVVTAVQCHHYLQADERETAVRKCYRALRDKGVFICFENIRMSTEESDGIALERWLHFLESRGNPPEDVRMHRDRRGIEIFPITIEEHIALLRKCGFSSVDLLWTSYLQAGFWAVK